MSASAQDYRPTLSKSSTGQTSASESRSERAPSPSPLEDREQPNLVDRFKERMRPRSRSDTYSSTATTLNQQSGAQCGASPMARSSSSDATREDSRKKAHRQSSELKPPMKRSSRSTYSDVGRHSNDWLFGGFSVKDTARGLLKRRDS